MVDSNSPIFIGGAGRSGTTLLRVILDSHPRIYCGPELKVTPLIGQMWHTFHAAQPALNDYEISAVDVQILFQQLFHILTSKMLKKSGKARIAEKTPGNARYFQHLHYVFPNSPLIHVIRDPRAVVASLLKMDWIDASTGKPLKYVSSVEAATNYWIDEVQTARATANHPTASRNYIEIKYENLVEHPKKVLEELLLKIGEDWNNSVLNHHTIKRNLAGESSESQVKQALYKSSISKWQNELTVEEIRLIEVKTAKLMSELNYSIFDNGQ